MDKQLAESLGKLAREARQRAGLTQADVAERLPMASEVYGRLERGEMLPSVTMLRKLSRALNVSADELLSLREPDLSPPPPTGVRNLFQEGNKCYIPVRADPNVPVGTEPKQPGQETPSRKQDDAGMPGKQQE